MSIDHAVLLVNLLPFISRCMCHLQLHHIHEHHDLGVSLSPSSNAKPLPETLLPLSRVGLILPFEPVVIGGGTKASKFKPLLAALAAAGVLFKPGVRPPHGAWAGDGVTLTKSAKLNC